MERTRRRQGYLERFNSKTGKWERAGRTKPTAPSAKPAPAKPTAKPAATKPNPFISGKPNPNAAARGVIGRTSALANGAGRLLGAAGIISAAGNEIREMSDRNKTFSWNRPKPVKKDANNRSSTGVRVSDKENNRDYKAAPTGSQQYNDYRNQQIAAERERLKGVGNPPKAPKPPAPKPQATRPAAPASPQKPTAPKERRVSAATANREAGNYGTSRTNNPMIDDAMKARMRQREDAAGVGPVKDGARYAADVKNSTKGVGPVKDGDRYASNLKPADKTKSEKGMTLAERMRRRRQSGMA